MEKIASFTVDHLSLEPGVYVSRVDRDPVTGGAVTTFDLRLTAPNREPVMNTAEVHTIEHLGATYLRNDAEWASRVVYFGPMGCRTGFYLVVFGEVAPARSCRSSRGFSNSYARSRARSLVPRPRSAATTSTRTCLRAVVGAPLPGGNAPRHRRRTSDVQRVGSRLQRSPFCALSDSRSPRST